MKSMFIAATSAASVPIEYKFNEYVSNYGKSYATHDEYHFRMNLFAKKDQLIEQWNADLKNTHFLGHNHFSDMTDHEMSKIVGEPMHKANRDVPVKVLPADDLPATVNWTETKGAVNPVGN